MGSELPRKWWLRHNLYFICVQCKKKKKNFCKPALKWRNGQRNATTFSRVVFLSRIACFTTFLSPLSFLKAMGIDLQMRIQRQQWRRQAWILFLQPPRPWPRRHDKMRHLHENTKHQSNLFMIERASMLIIQTGRVNHAKGNCVYDAPVRAIDSFVFQEWRCFFWSWSNNSWSFHFKMLTLKCTIHEYE